MFLGFFDSQFVFQFPGWIEFFAVFFAVILPGIRQSRRLPVLASPNGAVNMEIARKLACLELYTASIDFPANIQTIRRTLDTYPYPAVEPRGCDVRVLRLDVQFRGGDVDVAVGIDD